MKLLRILFLALLSVGLAVADSSREISLQASPVTQSSNCYLDHSTSPITVHNKQYTGVLQPKCIIQIATKDPESLMKTTSYMGNICITSVMGEHDCDSIDTSTYDVITIGTSADIPPENYTNSNQIRYIRMFGCFETNIEKGKLTVTIIPCSDLFKISQVQ